MIDENVPARFGAGAGGFQYYAECPALEPAAFADTRTLDELLSELRKDGAVRFSGVVTQAGNALKLVGKGTWCPGRDKDGAFSLRYLDGFNALALASAGEADDDEDEDDGQDEPPPPPRRPMKPLLNLGGS